MIFLLLTIWLICGMVSLIYVIMDSVKEVKSLNEFYLTIDQFLFMVYIIFCGPIIGCIIIYTNKDKK